MAAYRRVYGFRHLRADCRAPGSAPEPYARYKYGTTFTFTLLAVNSTLHADYFRAEEVLNICISVRGNQTDILSQLIKRYLFSVSISAFVCFYSVAERELTFDDLRRKTDQEPIVKQIKRRKWSWLGHNDNIAKQTTVDTARSRNTRRRDLESEMGSAGFKYSWRMMEVAAQDWTGWRKVVCGQCCTGNNKWRTCTELTSIASTLASQRTVNANE